MHFLLFVFWLNSDVTWDPGCCLVYWNDHTSLFHFAEPMLKHFLLVNGYWPTRHSQRWYCGVQGDVVWISWKGTKAFEDVSILLFVLIQVVWHRVVMHLCCWWCSRVCWRVVWGMLVPGDKVDVSCVRLTWDYVHIVWCKFGKYRLWLDESQV